MQQRHTTTFHHHRLVVKDLLYRTIMMLSNVKTALHFLLNRLQRPLDHSLPDIAVLDFFLRLIFSCLRTARTICRSESQPSFSGMAHFLQRLVDAWWVTRFYVLTAFNLEEGTNSGDRIIGQGRRGEYLYLPATNIRLKLSLAPLGGRLCRHVR
jgi:hypothetical protein